MVGEERKKLISVYQHLQEIIAVSKQNRNELIELKEELRAIITKGNRGMIIPSGNEK